MDGSRGRGNRRRRSHQNDEEDDRSTNRRRQTNQAATNGPQNDGHDDARLPLSLRLGQTPSSSQIPPTMTAPLSLAPSPLSLAPPTMTAPLSLSQPTTTAPLSLSQPTTTGPLSLAPPTTMGLLRLAPPSPVFPPMTTWPSPDFMARLASSQPYFMTSPPNLASSSLSNSLFQTVSRGSSTPMQQRPFGPSSFNLFPSLGFGPPPNQTPARPATRPTAESRRSYRSQSSGDRKDDTVPPPFPWATNKRGWIQSLENLESKQITTITGDVQCKHCEKVYQVSYNLRERFSEVEKIFVAGKRIMRERAPSIWATPEPVRCELCGRDKAVKPVIADRKRQINWLFLLLGQTLGFCTLEQLKNFCKHSKSHRTGAKDRVLYLTYLGLCKMLKPNLDLFNRCSSRG